MARCLTAPAQREKDDGALRTTSLAVFTVGVRPATTAGSGVHMRTYPLRAEQDEKPDHTAVGAAQPVRHGRVELD